MLSYLYDQTVLYSEYETAVWNGAKAQPNWGYGTTWIGQSQAYRNCLYGSATQHHNSPGPGTPGDIAMFWVKIYSHITMWVLGLVNECGGTNERGGMNECGKVRMRQGR
jgi:hypothetical protein